MSYKLIRLHPENHQKKWRSIDAIQRWRIEDAVESLNEKIERLKQELRYKSHSLQEIEQDLRQTKHKLYAALVSKWLTLDEAKELVKTTFASDLPAADALTEIFSVNLQRYL